MKIKGQIKLCVLGIIIAMISTSFTSMASGDLSSQVEIDEKNILIVSNIKIPNRVIKAGENSPILFTLENIGDVDATNILAEVYEVRGDNETLLTTLQYNKIKPGHEKTKTVVWEPSNVGYYNLKLVITYEVDGENYVMEHESGFNVIRSGLPEIKINGDWVINEPTEYENVVILVGGDVYVNAPLTLTDVHVLAGDWELDAQLTVTGLTGQATLDMECGYNGQYSMWVKDTGTLIVEGGEIIYNNPSNYNYGFIVDGQLIVDGGTVQNVGQNAFPVGTHPANLGTGIRLYNPDDAKASVFINGATVINCQYNGIYAEYAHVTVQNSFITNNGGMGIWLSSSDNNLIDNNDLSSNGQSSLFLANSHWNTITNNIAASNGGTVFASSNHNTISDNEFYGGGAMSISGTSQYNVIERNNLSLGSYGIYFYGGPQGPVANTIMNNEIWHNSIYGIYSYMRGNTNTISWNNIYYNTYGIYLYVTSHNSIQNNNIGYNEKGIVTYLSSDYLIRDNIITNNDYGIWQSADDGILTIEGNTITDNNNYGIYCLNAHAGYIRGNTIESNVDGGIYCSHTSHMIQDNPSISNNGYGIYTEFSSPTIERNTLGEGYFAVDNELVYGPAAGGEMGSIFLDNGNIHNSTLYMYDGTMNLLEEWTDYALDYNTGEIELRDTAPMAPGWIFYAWYNYSEGNGNTYGVYAISSTPTISDNRIIANDEAGIYIYNQADYARNPLISNNLIVGNKQGIYLFQSSATIWENDILSNRGSGIFVEESKGEINSNTIKYNAEPRGTRPDPQFTGIRVSLSSDLWIHHNNVSHNGQNIYLYESTNVNIEYNTMVDASAVILIYPTPPPPRGIYLVSSQMTASNNKIWGMIIGMDIESADSNTVISHNEFYPLVDSPPLTAIGIRLTGASAQIEWNTFNRIETGIYCTEGSNAVISDNTITNCFGTGIHTIGSSPTIVSNTIANNGGWGILSEYAAPANAGVDGVGIVADNPNLGDNGLGRGTQVWSIQILVQDQVTGLPQSSVYVEVYPLGGLVPVWVGYTDIDGLTETFDGQQYVIQNGAGGISVKNPHLVMCDGTPSGWLVFEANGIHLIEI